MAISAVNSSTAAAAQLLDQVRQASAKPEASESRATETAAEQRGEPARAAQENPRTAAPQPVVNTQGQVTGLVVNTLA